MNIRDDILQILLEYPQYKLVGAYSIVQSFNNKSNWEPRSTKDLDIRICCEIKDKKEIIKLKKILENKNYKVEIQTTKKENYRLYVSKNNSMPLKIDIEFKSGNDIESNIKNIDESIRDKFDLFMEHPDREFKHLVDVIICINSDYPEGITKKQMLNLIDESKLVQPNLETLLHLASKFKPQELNNMKMEDYAIAFDTLVKGLIDDNTLEEDLFKNNRWYEIN